MTAHRRWYVAGLVAAVMALVLSVGAAVAVATHRAAWWGTAAPAAVSRQGWTGPGPMGARSGWMMGAGDDYNAGSVTADQATATARAWVQSREPGATLGQPVTMPMGYVFAVTRDGQVLGTVMVNDDTGQLVWIGAVHPWPAPAPSAS